jgi:2,5-diamino-6-(ribosylamino)-4(3H)-pyrimidinone 5'-phosphate reductase
MNEARRPYVICHMVPSVDGRVVTANWKLPPGALAEYERTAETFKADAWMIGRVSMEPYAGKAWVPARRVPPPIPRTDFIARRDAGSYAIALDVIAIRVPGWPLTIPLRRGGGGTRDPRRGSRSPPP